MNLKLVELNRADYLGGSEVAAVLGVPGAWDSPFSVWARRQPELADHTTQMTPAMEAGHRFEEAVMGWSAAQLGADMDNLLRGEPFGGKVVQGAESWAACHPDGYLNIDGMWHVYEGKLASGQSHSFGPDGQMPDHYFVQWIYEQYCAQMPGAFGAQLSLREPPWTHTMNRNVVIEKMIIDRAGEWWHKHIVKGEAPEVDGSLTAKAWLSMRHKEHSNIMREPTSEESALVEELKSAKLSMKAMQLGIAKLENKIKEAIGGDEGLLYQGGPTFVSWRQQKGSNRLDQKKLRLEEPEVFNKYSKRGDPRRVLRAHPGWGAL